MSKDNIKEFKFTKTFKEEVIKFCQNKKNLKEKVDECIIDFSEKLFFSKFYRKPLKNGKFEKFNIHELQIGGDSRIIIQFKIEEYEGKYICYFINFGNHSSLNLSSSKGLKINPVN